MTTVNNSSLQNQIQNRYDAVTIGGGFYGAMIALFLKKQKNFKKICIIEKESEILTRASAINQARIHNGYHYPRSFTTAYRSRINFAKFILDWQNSVKKDFTKIYAIAKRGSKVTAKQFEKFCREIDAEISMADTDIKSLFNPHLIEKVFLAKEYAFDYLQLRKQLVQDLTGHGIEIFFNHVAEKVEYKGNQNLQIQIRSSTGAQALSLNATCIFNCTYSGLHQIGGEIVRKTDLLRHEITEMLLVKPPKPLDNLGITVMDGPFFSLMPYPSQGSLYTLSHVRYTPHSSWLDRHGVDPHQVLQTEQKVSRAERILRDAARYVPAIIDCEVKDSLYEVKTVLTANETDDGRPILFEKQEKLPAYYSVLGGKLDNVYDVLQKIDVEIKGME